MSNDKNVLVVFADQMHKYALGKVADYVYTPHLDALCDEGIRFSAAYSNNPICGPFRGNLLTGQYSSTSGVISNGSPLPDNVLSMAHAFRDGGYATSFVGKWHLGGNGNGPISIDLRGGFERFIGYQCYNGFYQDVRYFDEDNMEYRFDYHRTDVETDLAIQRIRELHAAGRPFFQVVAYQAPHYPVQPAPEFAEMYAAKEIPYPPDYQEVDPYTPTFSPPSPRPVENCPDYQRYGNNMQEYLRLYYAMVSQIDHGMGRILSTLDELGIRDSTMVLFTADHGDMQGSHGLKNKTLPYEKSCGIPLIVSVPTGRVKAVCHTPVSAIDIYPTVLDFAGLPHPNHLQGQSFAAYAMGKAERFENIVFAESTHGRERMNRWKMVRCGDWKLTVRWADRQATMLFDLKEDPYELNNLVDNPHHAETVRMLQNLIADRFAND